MENKRVRYAKSAQVQDIPSEISKMICESMVSLRQAAQLVQNSYALSCVHGNTDNCVKSLEAARTLLYTTDQELSDAGELLASYVELLAQQSAAPEESIQTSSYHTIPEPEEELEDDVQPEPEEENL
jgi:hypothetical protein